MGRFDDLELVFRELERLTAQQRPLPESLQAVAAEAPRRGLGAALAGVASETEQGTTLDAALRKRPGAFPAPLPDLIAAGLEADDLPAMCAIAAEHCEAEARFRRDLRGAMAYPIVTLALCIAIALLAGGMTAEVTDAQRLADALDESGMGLRGLYSLYMTQGQMSGPVSWANSLYATVLTRPITTAVVLLVLGLLAWGLIRLLLRSPVGRGWFARMAWFLPAIGPVYRAGVSARFLGTLGRLLRAGVPPDRATALTERLFPFQPVAHAAHALHVRVSEGAPPSEGFSPSPLVPESVAWLLRNADLHGDLPGALDEAAAYQRSRHERLAATFKTVWAPAVHLITGILVFFLMLALLSPLVGIYTSAAQMMAR